MRLLIIALSMFLALPAAAQDKACRGKQVVDFGAGASGCIVVIKEGSITTTRTRDDLASSSSRVQVQPMVAAAMSGTEPTKRSVIRKQLLDLCKVASADIKKQFATKKYNQIILVMDWRAAGGKIQSGFSNDKCKGFQFFNA